GIALLIVSGCAIALRLSAEALRARALRRLNDRIMAVRQSQDGERLAGQLELLSRRIEELRDGAFTPFSQQPLVRTMLLPLGSFGGTALLEYLLLPRLSLASSTRPQPRLDPAEVSADAAPSHRPRLAIGLR